MELAMRPLLLLLSSYQTSRNWLHVMGRQGGKTRLVRLMSQLETVKNSQQTINQPRLYIRTENPTLIEGDCEVN